MADDSKESSPASAKDGCDHDDGSDDGDGEMENEKGITEEGAVEKLSEYEVRRAQNIAENKARLDELDAQLRVKYDLPETAPFVQSKTKQKKPRADKSKQAKGTVAPANRRSNRQSG